MDAHIATFIAQHTDHAPIRHKELIQTLWSGYGELLRIHLNHPEIPSVILKHIKIPIKAKHPRGWNTDIGHQRKLKSYEVETNWYQSYSNLSMARVPGCLAVDKKKDEVLILLEDLDQAGFPLRKSRLNWQEIKSCLKWLATFHGSFMGRKPQGLWEIGTYWHLATRPQELQVLKDKKLKHAASKIDATLNTCTYQTLVHGDAKLANFCFGADGSVAAVDFQYVGGGCGMKDVAYFIGSCLSEEECERREDEILDTYFHYLDKAIPAEIKPIEAEWRPLYRVAWADFHRFLKGWSPDHWKINSYSERITRKVLEAL